MEMTVKPQCTFVHPVSGVKCNRCIRASGARTLCHLHYRQKMIAETPKLKQAVGDTDQVVYVDKAGVRWTIAPEHK